MSTMSLRADVGRETGSRAAGRLRSAGKVPAVVYGHGTDTRSIAVDHRELDLALSGGGRNAIFELDLDGTVETAVVHQIDRHPTKNRILHVDFVLVDLDQEIDADITIRVEGEGPGVKEGGVVELIRPTVQVRGVVSKLPNEIVVDASELEIGDTIHIAELPEVEGIEYLEDDELTVLTVTITRAAAMGEEAFEAELAAAAGAEPTEPGTVGEETAEAEEPAEDDEG